MATQVTYSLSPAETIIMEFIWGNNCHARTYEIMNYLVQDKGIKWERQTLNTVLIRLSNKGIIERRDHRSKIYQGGAAPCRLRRFC